MTRDYKTLYVLFSVLIGWILSCAMSQAQDAQLSAPECSLCSTLVKSGQTVVGDRSIAPYKVYPVYLNAGNLIDVIASGGVETIGQFDVSLYAPQANLFDFNHATCLARGFAGAVTSKVADASGQPTTGSGCQSYVAPTVSQTNAKAAKGAHPVVVKSPVVKPIGGKAHIRYSVPVTGWYFLALEFSGSGVEVVVDHKEQVSKSSSQQVRQPSGQQVSQPSSQQANQASSQEASQSSSQQAAQPSSQEAGQASSQQVRWPLSQQVSQSSSQQAAQPSNSQTCDSTNVCDIQVGPMTLHVLAVPNGASIRFPRYAQLKSDELEGLSIFLNGKKVIDGSDLLKFNFNQQPSKYQAITLTLADLAAAINALNNGIVAQVTQRDDPTSEDLDLRAGVGNAQNEFSMPNLKLDPSVKAVTIWRNFVFSLDQNEVAKLRNDHTRVSIRTSDGAVFSLFDGYSEKPNPWTYISNRGPFDRGRMIVVRVDKAEKDTLSPSAKYDKDWFAQSDPDSYAIYGNAEFVLIRRRHTSGNATLDDLILGMKTSDDGRLEIYKDATVDNDYRIDGTGLLLIGPTAVSWVDAGPSPWLIEWFDDTGTRCRPAPHDPQLQQYASVVVHPPAMPSEDRRRNGIMVGGAKIFDTLTLQKMLNDTAAQLAGLNVFNGAQLSSAVGSLQGITRETSFVNAQLTTVPTAATTQSSSTGVTTPNTTQTTTPIGSTTVTLQCPDGSLPTIGSSTTLGGCTTIPLSGTTPNVPVYAPVSGSGNLQGTLTTTPAGSTVTNNGSTTTTQNGATNSTSSVSGAAPAALTANPLAAPTNVGVASSDILAEQVQLHAQLISLRLLLQGALSDQFISRNAIAVGVRRQTTLGFAISLDAPRQFKHAVAEVRVVVYPPRGLDPRQNPVSLMTLLPAEKTYNVAKVTSHQNAFGAGAVVEPISFGLSAGKSKDKLYLAKDTDTLALQFQSRANPIRTHWPEHWRRAVKSAVEVEPLDGCRRFDQTLPSEAVVFGWQFRPVLGEDYVLGGQRQVFAQLALPGTDRQEYYPPRVTVETYWREYDPKAQVVGAIYEDTCSFSDDESDIALINQTHVDDLDITDLGGGQLSLNAKGQFYLSSLGVIAGANTLVPRVFDGGSIQVVASAHDLLESGDLTLVNASGQMTSFSIEPTSDRSCGISAASMKAVPYPDGNSRATVMLDLGTNYNISSTADRPPHPLIMIGDSVFGLKETPFIDSGGLCFTFGMTTSSGKVTVGTKCQYNFIAPTTALRNAQTFLARDISWEHFAKSNRISFAPSFTSLAVSSSTDPAGTGGTHSSSTSYVVQGFDFSRIDLRCLSFDESLTPCLRVFVGDNELPLDDIGFTIESENVARLTLSNTQLGKAKSVRFQLQWQKDDPANTVEWSIAVPKNDVPKPTPSPAFLRVGDGQKVSFTGGELCGTVKNYVVTFQGNPLAANCNGSSLDVFVTTSVTALFGHKEFTITAGGVAVQSAGSPVSLAIDVLRQ
jgi:hypothetical protein